MTMDNERDNLIPRREAAPEPTPRVDESDLEFLLSEFAAGQLSGGKAHRLRKQLARDPGLSAELRKYSALDAGLDALADEEIEGVDYEQQRSDIVRLVERKVLLSHRRPRLRWQRVAAPLAMAAAVAIALSAWLLYPTGTVAPPSGDPGGPETFVRVQTPAPDAPEGVIRVALAGPGRAEAGTVRVRPVRVEWDELRFGALATGRDASRLPPGTVLVSADRTPTPAIQDPLLHLLIQ